MAAKAAEWKRLYQGADARADKLDDDLDAIRTKLALAVEALEACGCAGECFNRQINCSYLCRRCYALAKIREVKL